MVLMTQPTGEASHRLRQGSVRPEDFDEEAAATRIQALYRGRGARKRHGRNRFTHAPSGPSGSGSLTRGQMRSLGRAGRTATTPAASRNLAPGAASSERTPSKSSSMPPNPALAAACAEAAAAAAATGDLAFNSDPSGLPRPHSPMSQTLEDLPKITKDGTDYSLIRRQLEARPTTVPREIQRWRIYLYILFEEPRSSLFAQVLSIGLLFMIITSIVCFMIETMPELKHVPKDVWLVIEICCTIVFTIEYVIRISVCGVVGIKPWQIHQEHDEYL